LTRRSNKRRRRRRKEQESKKEKSFIISGFCVKSKQGYSLFGVRID
jgi:hypothetical protein